MADSPQPSPRRASRPSPAAVRPRRSIGTRPLGGKGKPLRGSTARLAGKGRPLGRKGAPVGLRNLLVPASDAQREKVAGRACLVCARTPVDAAHLVPQRLGGGCADPTCVIGACRACHNQWDAGGFDLRPYLGDGFQAELEHALTHVSATALERALSGGGWGLPRWRRKP